MEAETKIRLLRKPEITYKSNIFRVHAMKAYGEWRQWLHSFLNLAQDGMSV